jgi:hypothetical protein
MFCKHNSLAVLATWILNSFFLIDIVFRTVCWGLQNPLLYVMHFDGAMKTFSVVIDVNFHHSVLSPTWK